MLGQPSTISVQIENDDNVTQDFLIQATIQQSRDIEFLDQEIVLAIAPRQKHVQSFTQKWIPLFAGSHTLSVDLLSLDKAVKFDSNTIRLDINGSVRYDVIASCPSRMVPAGELVDFSLQVFNAGDYFQDVDLSWDVVDSGGKLVSNASIPIAVKPNETITRQEKLLVPESASPGTYFIKAKATFQEQVKEGQCSFAVQSREPHYDQQVRELEGLLDRVGQKIAQKESESCQLTFAKSKFSRLRESVERMREKITKKDFDGLSEQIPSIRSELLQFLDDLENISCGLGLSTTLLAALLFAILLLLLFLLWKKRDEGDEDEPKKSWLDELLGLEGSWSDSKKRDLRDWDGGG